ncbi:class I SAM-dependent methyltransferase [Patescibacteria group bacterium]|nr:class I SAM-dependent methyltransferase [Candidatus Micrarchaeota archaeon]MBU1758368.1 class I SAM-dependent methyltransferase [Patescibacteria group bacterium]
MEEFYGRFRIYNKFLEAQKSDTILSVGCRSAFFEEKIADKVKAIYAIDIDRRQIEKNKKGKTIVVFGYSDITKRINFSDNYFDKVIFTEVMEHLPRETEIRALREINRILKSEGQILFSTPYSHPLSNITDPTLWLMDHRHYKEKEISDYLEKTGFVIEKVFIGGGYLQAFFTPIFYLLCLFRVHDLIGRAALERVIDREYRDGKGFGTIIIKARKVRRK